jgi:hypothetical protein
MDESGDGWIKSCLEQHKVDECKTTFLVMNLIDRKENLNLGSSKVKKKVDSVAELAIMLLFLFREPGFRSWHGHKKEH